MRFSTRFAVLAIGLLLLLLLAGCGKGLYEQRIENTKVWYRRVGLLDAALQRDWSLDGLRIRPPKNLEEKLRPAPAEGEGEGADVVAVPDSRQPNFVNVELPGLKGAWRGAGGTEMYIMSNAGLRRTADIPGDVAAEDPGTVAERFNPDVGKILCDLAAVDFDYSRLNVQRFPATNQKYVLPVDYRTIVIRHEDSRGVVRRMSLYFYEGGEVGSTTAQVAILVVEPESTLTAELTAAVDLSLQTLEVTPSQFGSSNSEGGGGGASGAPGKSF